MSCAAMLVALVLAGTMAVQDISRSGAATPSPSSSILLADMPQPRSQWVAGPVLCAICRLRGGSRDATTGSHLKAGPSIDEADIVGDIPGEDESDETLRIPCASDTSHDAAPAVEDEESSQTDRIRKTPFREMEGIGVDRQVWKGRYWANLEQKRCEVLPTVKNKYLAAEVRPRSILWGEDCAEATMDAPPGYFRPYGDAIPLNDTWIGEWPDGTPALLGDVCCGSGDTALDLENCYSHSDSRECVDEIVAAYRAEEIRKQNVAAGTPLKTNPYVTTGWGHPKHPGGPPESEEFDPAKHQGYDRFLGPGGTPPDSLEELPDEYSDGKWGIDHVEVRACTRPRPAPRWNKSNRVVMHTLTVMQRDRP